MKRGLNKLLLPIKCSARCLAHFRSHSIRAIIKGTSNLLYCQKGKTPINLIQLKLVVDGYEVDRGRFSRHINASLRRKYNQSVIFFFLLRIQFLINIVPVSKLKIQKGEKITDYILSYFTSYSFFQESLSSKKNPPGPNKTLLYIYRPAVSTVSTVAFCNYRNVLGANYT